MAATRHSILQSSSSSSASATAALQTRIAQKRSELAHLQQLRELSAQMAEQMRVLEQKLAGLADGTEAVACVLANWENVMRAIHMAATATATAAAAEKNGGGDGKKEKEGDLPVTLVRIPVAPTPTPTQTQTQDHDH